MTRIVLVTGANRGIGFETASQLARRGFHVVIAARNEASGGQAAKEIQASEGSAAFLPLDVSDSQSIREAANRFATISDRLDVLINNAGIYSDEGVTIATVSRDRLVQTFQTNTFGPLEVAQAFLPYLRHAGTSRIINISSGYGQRDGMSPDAPSYCLSKLH